MPRIACLLLPEYSNLGLAAVVEPLFIANWLMQRPLFEWQSVSADGNAVKASNGMMGAVSGKIAMLKNIDALFVIASFDAVVPSPVMTALRRLARFGVEIVGVENGSLVLAKAGLLDGQDAAIHWDNLTGFRERYPAVRALEQLYVRGGDRTTCAGAAAILDMMTAWIGAQVDTDLAQEVSDHLLLDHIRSGNQAQKRAVSVSESRSDPEVDAAQAIMRNHIDEKLPCGDIARRVDLSLRQLERRFKAQLGRTMAQEYVMLRMAHAHRLLQQTPLQVGEIAFASGFASPEHFSRLYRRTFGCAPRSDRAQTTEAPVLRALPLAKRRAHLRIED